MIAFPRRVARRFRAACAKCICGRPRGPAPPVVIRQSKGRVTLTATFPEVTLELACGTPESGTEVLIVPMAVLDEIGSVAPELVGLEGTGMLTGVARWTKKGEPRTHEIDLILPGKQHDALARPQELEPVPYRFLELLHEAGRTATREDGRFALSRVQVRGQKGQVIATDGKVAVIFGGFALPFIEDLLVPAVPLFGSPELRDDAEVRVGRTPKHFVVNAGDWTVWLGVATVGKFPDVAAVVPKHAPTAVTLDRGDAAGLLPQLSQMPGQSHEHRPVTLDANGVLKVHARDDTTRESKEVVLARSSVTGPTAKAVLDRRAFARMLALGCTALRFTPDKAVVGTGEGVTVLAAQLDRELAVVPNETAIRVAAEPDSINPTPVTTPERSTVMKPDTNGTAHTGRRDPPPDEPIDPLDAAEELRLALVEVANKAGRLVAALKASRKERKALASVWATLDQLRPPQRNGVKP